MQDRSTLINDSKPCRVLIVDDDEMHRMLEKDILADGNYIIDEACDGVEGLEAIKSKEYDVILLDKRMPNMDGDEVCYHIRNTLKLPLLPIIMVTGSNSQEELAASMKAGATDFINKPYNNIELISRLNAAAYQKRLTDQLDSAESMLFALARMVEAKDEHTGDHCSRLEHIVYVLGTELGLDDEELKALQRGGILHDIGKLGIPDSILLKNGPLTDEEWVIMKQHTTIGARLCEELKSMRLTVPIIKHHHERWDGSGYPEGLKGNEIPYLARVFQVADIYDALASERPYKKPFSREKIISVFEEEVSRGWRDPELINIFLNILRERPEDLAIPSDLKIDQGSVIFEDIKSTGVIDWDREKTA